MSSLKSCSVIMRNGKTCRQTAYIHCDCPQNHRKFNEEEVVHPHSVCNDHAEQFGWESFDDPEL